jgi:hypothetical protein
MAAWIVFSVVALVRPIARPVGAQAVGSQAQAAGAQASPTAADSQHQAASAVRGTVLFQSHGAPPEPADSDAADERPAASENPAAEGTYAGPQALAAPTAKPAGPELTDSERSSIRFKAYDLDAHFSPASASVVMRARVTLENVGPTPLARVAMQISSTLHWESVALLPAADAFPATRGALSTVSPALPATGAVRLNFAQHLLDTDADHTGQANEIVVLLPQALAPGETVQLDTFYAGSLAASDGRLLRLGATATQASASDWDDVSAHGIALRGFGNVLWYPVASPQLFLGEGAQLFAAVGAMRLREQGAQIHLKLTADYTGDPPVAAYFCGRRSRRCLTAATLPLRQRPDWRRLSFPPRRWASANQACLPSASRRR